MKPLYEELWQKAKPYYEKGRPMDIPHIEWMMQTVELVCQKEHIDDTLLMPLAILHDVGYSEVQNVEHADYYNTDIRATHMKAGADIARRILSTISYPEDKVEKIIHYVSVHDNWAYGQIDIYTNDTILGIFKDLDFLWIYTEIGCQAIQKVLGKDDKAMLMYLRSEPSPIYGKKPFSVPSTKALYDKYLEEREKEFQKKDI
jgi:hypothetical protein